MVNPDGVITDTNNDSIYLGRDIDGDGLAKVGHSFNTGDKVIYSNNGTTIAPLASGTPYYIIKKDSYYVQLALSYQDAKGLRWQDTDGGMEMPILGCKTIPISRR